MITPFEIESKEFNKELSGYKKIEVNEYLYDISNDLEYTLKELESKDREIERLNEELKKFNRIEKNLSEALVIAKETANEVISNAKVKADNIVKESEINAKKIIDNANEEVVKAISEFEGIKKEIKVYKVKMKALIQRQLEINELIDNDIK